MATSVRQGGGQKWKDRASIATDSYESGIKNPRNDWATATQGANDSYKSGVQAAIAADRFKKGVQKAGSAKQQQGALSKGSARYAQGVQVSQVNYENGIAPYLDVIKSLTLPPRGSKGAAQNLQRVAAVSVALRQKKLST